MTECQGTWREVPNHETDDPLLECSGCGELMVIHKGKAIVLKEGAPK